MHNKQRETINFESAHYAPARCNKLSYAVMQTQKPRTAHSFHSKPRHRMKDTQMYADINWYHLWCLCAAAARAFQVRALGQ